MDADSTERLSLWQWLLGKILQLNDRFLLVAKNTQQATKNQQVILNHLNHIKSKLMILVQKLFAQIPHSTKSE
ncbi:hypothetical protein DS885_04305 [Psychromonas sp. B3M02]|nr:hypothetical protein DS885_04305 [Psychromonas sp. B3M02]